MNTTTLSKWRRWKLVLLILLTVVLLVAAAAAYVLSLPAFGARMEGERLARARTNP